eukprot:scaffold9163_cov27-Tisochrysis_lutea.AAC.2
MRAFCAHSYMVLSGHDGEEDHALRLLRTAADMLALTSKPLQPSGERVRVRIGLNTGSAHSGVLGTQRLKYSVWGDRGISLNSGSVSSRWISLQHLWLHVGMSRGACALAHMLGYNGRSAVVSMLLFH